MNGRYAARGMVYGTSLAQTAQAKRPSLLATVIVALLWPRRSRRVTAH